MKNILLYFSLFLITSTAVLAQPTPGGVAPVITEIMYNPPESGNDTLEFIEISNPSLVAMINMSGYYIDDAFDFTFPSGFVLQAGESVVISGDSVIFENTFGVAAFEWEGSTTQLNNSGEPITLKNSANAVVDSVFYGTSGAWPTVANAGGYSLVLCDPTADNSLAANWYAAETTTGVVVNAVEIFADPGSLSTCTPTSVSDDNVITTILYPNPTEGVFNLRFEPFTTAGTLQIHNSLGQMVYSDAINSGASAITISEVLAKGYYVVSIDKGTEVEKHKLTVK